MVLKILILFATIFLKLSTDRGHYLYVHTVFPDIVSSLEYFPSLNSFLTSVRKLFKFLLHKGKIDEETTYLKYGMYSLLLNTQAHKVTKWFKIAPYR